jgi:peroxiredoxin
LSGVIMRTLLAFLLLSPIVVSAPPVTFALRDAAGGTHTSAEVAQHKATVFVFLATDCPNSNSYAPELARIFAAYRQRGVAFYGVYSDPAETAAGVRKHDHEYRIPFPALLDPQQILARETGAQVTPEAVAVSSNGEVRYRGRIDDRYADFGKARLHIQTRDLRTALDEILEGKAVARPYMPSIGCAIPGVGPSSSSRAGK